MSTTQQQPERLQKLLARAGMTSRRKAEEMIEKGQVTVNGKIAQLGDKAIHGKDKILVDGTPLAAPELLVYLRLYKPRGFLTAMSDDTGRPIITELITDIPERVFPVGRLDYDSEGLLLLTNDGDLANALMHPSYQIQRTYYAKVRGNPSANVLRQLVDGVKLEDGLAQALHVEKLQPTPAGHTWIELTLTEGRNREVRRMCESIGHPVLRLRRVRFGNVDLEGLQPGEYQYLSENAVKELRNLTGNRIQAPQTAAKPVNKPKPKQKPKNKKTADASQAPHKEIPAFTTKRVKSRESKKR
ncbi:MAG: rRNA pseudouridine synthase [Myxococcales bacterium]|nr:rRNA pseudouridine synthase [Myxococcales bacterium]MCB9644737.1 rRNA pseudouridine synthase [Myxococcales bacterium]